jgi:hypothetical protein
MVQILVLILLALQRYTQLIPGTYPDEVTAAWSFRRLGIFSAGISWLDIALSVRNWVRGKRAFSNLSQLRK